MLEKAGNCSVVLADRGGSGGASREALLEMPHTLVSGKGRVEFLGDAGETST